MARLRQGRAEIALRCFRKVLELQPESADAQAKLAVAMVNAGKTEAAVPVFQRALQQNPGSAELHDQFAQVLRALGRNREAGQQADEAARLRR